MIGQKATLTKDLKYVKDEQPKMAKKGTEVLVDIAKGIALIGNDHIDIFPEEYKILYMN